MIEVELNMKKSFVIVLVISILTFNILTVNADEASSSEAHLSGTSVNCDYGNGIVFTNEEGELSGSFTSNGLSCRKTVSYEAGECPAFVLVQTPHNGTCSVTFSDSKKTKRYIKLKKKTEGCFYYMQQVRYTFTRSNDKWNVIMNPDSGRSVDIADSLNATETCPETIYISFPTGNVVHFNLKSAVDNGANKNEDPEESRNEEWEELGENVSSEDFDQKIECPDIIDIDTPGSFGWMLNTVLNYIKIIGPILVVLLSAIDFIKAVVGFDEKAMKEAQSKLIIRLVAALCLFLVPTLVQLLLSFINATTCTLG